MAFHRPRREETAERRSPGWTGRAATSPSTSTSRLVTPSARSAARDHRSPLPRRGTGAPASPMSSGSGAQSARGPAWRRTPRSRGARPRDRPSRPGVPRGRPATPVACRPAKPARRGAVVRVRSISHDAASAAGARPSPRDRLDHVAGAPEDRPPARCGRRLGVLRARRMPRSSSSAVWTIGPENASGEHRRAGSAAWPMWPIIASSWSRGRPRSSATNERVARALARRGRRGRAGRRDRGRARDRGRPAIAASSPARAWAPASHRWATGAVARPYRVLASTQACAARRLPSGRRHRGRGRRG